MSDVIIRAENLGKKYTIGHQAENGRYVALRDVLVHNAKMLLIKTRDLVKGNPIIQGDTTEEVWALKDINFEIKRGEAVGIIGRNGAGKSTLLKILSRITEPTTGRVTIKGRVASLLEVGTGFHPELSGRENIYLNGTILGMTRAEIKKKFDEIVAFAEIEKYLDTPVKRYSSGMYVRLAFAVAAHLEPEILVVDEVLAVGDADFQKKCLGKMEEVGKEGRTVLFVSHNMGAIQAFCGSALLLCDGKLQARNTAQVIVEEYMESILKNRVEIFIPKIDKPVYIDNIEIMNNKVNRRQFTTDENIQIGVSLVIREVRPNADLLLFIRAGKLGGKRLLLIEESLMNIKANSKSETSRVIITIPSNFLMAGSYSCEIGLLDSVSQYIDRYSMVGAFEIVQGNNPFLKYGDRDLGLVFSKDHKIEIS